MRKKICCALRGATRDCGLKADGAGLRVLKRTFQVPFLTRISCQSEEEKFLWEGKIHTHTLPLTSAGLAAWGRRHEALVPRGLHPSITQWRTSSRRERKRVPGIKAAGKYSHSG